jgi:hypothetical protein
MTRRTPLSTGQRFGDIIQDGDLTRATINKFLSSGTLTRITTPPLSELPDEWEKRANKLSKAGIYTIDDLVKAKPGTVAKQIKMTARTVKRWQQEAIDYLSPKQTIKKGN